MFSFPILAQSMWTSLATSTCFVLFALAFSLVLKVNRVFNFAQAAMMTVGFYAAFTVVGRANGPGWLGFIAALAGSVAVSILLEIFGFRVLRRRRASSMFVFIFALVISELVAYLVMLVFGTWPATIFPSLFWPVTLVGPVAVSQWNVPAVAATAITAVVLGIVQNASVLFIPSEWQGFLLYVFLFLAIVFFPKGIRLPERRLSRAAPPPSVAADEPGEA